MLINLFSAAVLLAAAPPAPPAARSLSVAFAAPLAGQSFARGVASVSVDASGGSSDVTVELFLDNASMGNDVTPPYTWDTPGLRNLSPGKHQLRAVGTDRGGQRLVEEIDIVITGEEPGLGTGPVALFVDEKIATHRFAAQELKAALAKKGIKSAFKPLSGLTAGAASGKIVIADARDEHVRRALEAAKATEVPALGAQAYALRTTGTGRGRSYWALGDRTGAMYGGLFLGEHVAHLLAGSRYDLATSPAVPQRGIKFNIPLDARSPSYSDDSHSAQGNIAEMWSLPFWTTYFDEMARARLNVLSLWSLNPWPSMVAVPEYPKASLADVKVKAGPLWDADSRGRGMFDPAWPLTTVKKMTIAEKVAFWKQVMQLAADRGIGLYVFTWNIFNHGLEEAGITRTTPDYWRAATRAMFATYPLLAGIGVTNGENMDTDGEEWLWAAYGQGFSDARKAHPGRDMRLIHRAHMTDPKSITKFFGEVPGYADADSSLAFSFKYSQAHMHTSTKPTFIDSWIGKLPPGKKTWLEVRADDQYYTRWGDPDFVRGYVRNMPAADKLAGFFVGPDGYTWGRELLSKEPQRPRQLVISKFSDELAMWGKLGFDPTTPNGEFQNALANRFPTASAAAIATGLRAASKVIPLVNRFYWGDLDFKWYPEMCWSVTGFNTVTDFIVPRYAPMGSKDGDQPGLLSIKESLKESPAGPVAGRLTALEVAALLQRYATEAATSIVTVKHGSNKELRQFLSDIDALAHLGRYYAEKIRGGFELARENRAAAVTHLQSASTHWKKYAAQLTSEYVPSQILTRMGLTPVDLKAIQAMVDEDVTIARGRTEIGVSEPARK